ncbi:hypothetical protein K435DRAFT_814998 [Dendrothele bispora CBS 962.96]|uniref:BTB domain-containing protein n=1 Tax=Dendrothele bispora (strain CBS 962.96) TaxID=1314807 RepID=A0A4V4HJ18_DENBC|nr:hypothetical protein K435DRAFT_814998 [Dendrothele bispora CBS 962.96]
MDVGDWDSVLQFASDSMDINFQPSKPVVPSSVTSPRLQAPTPPDSHDGSPVCDAHSDGNVLVSVSTTFYPGANIHSFPPDIALLSADSVFFYVHSQILLSTSNNNFRKLIPSSPPSKGAAQDLVIHVPEQSPVLNVILHAVYDMSCAHYSPPFEVLVMAVNSFHDYGIEPRSRIVPSTPLYTLLLSHAPLFPLDVYTLASKYDLYDLAVSTSPHLLSFQLSSLTDEIAVGIGPKYLKRLFFLHIGRSDALKRLLLQPPHPHAPTPWCDFTDQKTLTRAWALASAYLAWDARPDLSTSFLESALSPLAENLSCDLCKQALNDRIKNLIVQWSVVKVRIIFLSFDFPGPGNG